MTSFTSILRNTIPVIILSILFTCSPTQAINEKGEKQTVDLGSYTVDSPTGGNWKADIDKGGERVQFLKQAKSLFGGGLPVTTIHVSHNSLLKEEMWQLSNEEIANNYRDGEVANMSVRGVVQGSYILTDVKRGIITIDGNKLYTLSYKQKEGKWFGTDKVGESVLYLYFPPSFKEKHIFYLFLISEINKRDKQITADLTPILPVIKSLHIK